MMMGVAEDNLAIQTGMRTLAAKNTQSSLQVL